MATHRSIKLVAAATLSVAAAMPVLAGQDPPHAPDEEQAAVEVSGDS